MRNKKILIPLVALVSLALLLTVLEKTHVTDFIKLNPNPTTIQGPTPEQIKQAAEADANAKRQLIENPDSNTATPTQTPATENSVDLTAKQEANNTVTVFTKLSGYSSGTCSLTVTNGEKTTTQTAAVYYQPEYSSCAGFSVPISSLGTGTWSLALTVTANGSSVSKTITAKVN